MKHDDDEVDGQPPLRMVTGGGHRAGNHQGPSARLVDPHSPLPGPIKRVRSQRLRRTEKRGAQSQYDAYLTLLVRYQGDPVAALAQLYDLPEEEVVERQRELHAAVAGEGALDRSLDALMKDYDLTQPALLAVLRRHMYSNVPAASLKAADMIRDMFGDVAVGESIEDIVRLALSDDG